jgi:N-acetyl-gamma-glutamyl-phosphate reductase
VEAPATAARGAAATAALDVAEAFAPRTATAPATAPGAGSERVPAIVLGGSGYVGGELLRLLGGHPVLLPAAAVSSSRTGEPVAAAFPHLAGALPGLVFAGDEGVERVLAEHPRAAAFCAAPHGEAARLVDRILAAAEGAGCELSLVDVSADFRFASPAEWERVYGRPHGAPGRLGEFACGVPELLPGAPARRIAHPGCFTTAVLLAAVPLVALGLVEPELVAVATTGSTGAGRALTATTHHPERRSDLFAYAPLAHRHQPEMESLAAAAGAAASIRFVPQAGPFARGIHATLVARAAPGVDAESARRALSGFYAGSPFVGVEESPPRLAAVVGSNRCHLAVAADGPTLVAFAVLDNLVKGAAGGALQWMNRLLGLEETMGLTAPGLGWI